MDIPSFYAGRAIFLTGGTGFLGKVLLEKLLRSCPDIKCVYLLVRGKGATTPAERMAEIFNGSLYERLHKEQPNFAEKVIPLSGELTEENLGLSPEDYSTLTENVTIIIHSAATVKFTEKIKIAVDLNVLVVRRMLDLARKVKSLTCFMHISTAYAHTNRQFIEERVYPPSMDPQRLINLTDQIDDEMAESLTPHFLGARPNSYTFTKSIAEFIVSSESKGLPCMILRPSIVSSTWKEPVPGWIDNLNGPTGVAMAAGSGLARFIVGDAERQADIIPVDVTANYIIAAAWYSSTHLFKEHTIIDTPVYNCAIGNQNRGTWGQWASGIGSTFKKYPLQTKSIRRVKFELIHPSKKFEIAVRAFILQTVPGHFLDLVMRLTGQKPIVMRMYAKMDRAFKELTFFTSNEWRWEDNRSKEIMAVMSDEDRKHFSLDVRSLHWPSYIENVCIGIKKYVMKEKMEDLAKARSVQRRHVMFSMFVRAVFLFIIFKFVIPFLRARGMSLKALWILSIPTYYLASKKL
jgi:fatty acyl-CoA reductase